MRDDMNLDIDFESLRVIENEFGSGIFSQIGFDLTRHLTFCTWHLNSEFDILTLIDH